ncbi:uncharacterized protein LOC121895458 [Thunnus maccoyii]|uniref:uncharacterized protein LOC121895458 n=1 Tax=Thunnus maccoyii TaxID=8240 RepID=UPI001C4CEBB3|nr:uncharacterized protein LOC121895458 [Thunnus maccoyii]
MVKIKLYLRRYVGRDFFEFLKETDRLSITDREDLKDIYDNEFRARNECTRDPDFSSVLYALRDNKKVTRSGVKFYFNSSITSLYLDQWDHQPEQNCNGVAILQPEEAVSGVRARRELASQLMNRLRTDSTHRDQLISDKRGIRITSDHVFKDGTLYLRVESASEYVVNLTVENMGRKPVYFTYYTPLRWLRFFTLNDERKVTKTNPLTLNPGDGYEIQVRFHCSLVGFYPAILAFEFQPDLHSTPFHIVRFIEAQCMTTTFFLRSPPHAHHDGINICLRCMLFYDTFVDIAPNKRETLDHRTVEQRASHLWYDARKLRLTASTAKRVPTRGNPQNYIRQHLYPSFHGNAATHHGIESEALAFQWLQNCGYVVTRRGTVVCAGEPWLSASPDGVLNSEELLEIKCPFLTGNESLEDLIRSQRYDVKMVEGKYQLQKNGKRGFYMQVQLGMFCTGLRSCQLLIWTPSQQVLLPVPYDKQFCADTVARLRIFYFEHMLPYVSDEFEEGSLLLSARYLQLCRE